MSDLMSGLFFLSLIVGPVILAVIGIISSGRNRALEIRREADVELASIELEKIRLKTISELCRHGALMKEAVKAIEQCRVNKEDIK